MVKPNQNHQVHKVPKMNHIEKPETLRDYLSLNQPSRVRSLTYDYVTRPHMYPTFTGMEGAYTYPRESIDERLSALASRIDALEPNRYF